MSHEKIVREPVHELWEKDDRVLRNYSTTTTPTTANNNDNGDDNNTDNDKTTAAATTLTEATLHAS